MLPRISISILHYEFLNKTIMQVNTSILLCIVIKESLAYFRYFYGIQITFPNSLLSVILY